LATAGLLATGLLYAAAAALHLDLLVLDGGVLLAMTTTTLSLLGHACLLGTVLAYARHVYLDALGKLPQRTAKRPRRKGKRRRASSGQEDSNDSQDSDEETDAESPASRSGRRRAKRTRRARVDAQHGSGPAASDRRSQASTEDSTDQHADAASEGARAGKAKTTRRRRDTSSDDARPTDQPNSEAAVADSLEEVDTSNLSKAERRRLRKLRRRQNKAQAG
jgi:hypothetical protein